MIENELQFVVAITDENITVKYLKKYVAAKRIQTTEQLSSAKVGTKGNMIRLATLLRSNGFKAWAQPLNL